MTEKQLRQRIVDIATAYIGILEGGEQHRHIIDTYNAHKPLARGYKVTYTDAWCATFASYCYITAGLSGLLTTECGCEEMIRKNPKIWVEDDAYVPRQGDLIFYDWQDSGKGDCKGRADHVGIVEKVIGMTMTIIEGNSSDSVKRHTRTIGQQYIRGYICPDFKAIAEPEYESWVGQTTTALNVRTGPGTQYPKYQPWKVLGKGNKVRVFGETDGWYHIRIAEIHEAWASAKYITRVPD